MKEHFKKHGGVHALWAISILMLLVAWLLLKAPNGELIGQYIGFASSVASLVLALVAIGYAFVSNQGFSKTVGALEVSSRGIHGAASNIVEVSRILSEKAEVLTGEVARVPDAVRTLSEKIDASFVKAVQAAADEPSGTPSSVRYRNLRSAAVLSVYILVKSSKTGKPFRLQNMFVDDKAKIWAGIVAGVLITIDGFEVCGVSLDFEADDGEKISVKSLGSIDCDEVILASTRINGDMFGDLIKSVEKYFE